MNEYALSSIIETLKEIRDELKKLNENLGGVNGDGDVKE